MEIKLQPKDQGKFKYLSFSKEDEAITGTFPDFLILGPQRTGTTWLSENLRLHPEIFLSIPKELYFFNRLTEKPKRSLHFENLVKRSSGKKFYAQPKVVREFVKVFYFDYLITGKYKADQLEWYLQFFKPSSFLHKRHSETIRKNYGLDYQPSIFGEATASYAVMNKSLIKEVCMLNPETKGILMVRNPIERAWSHAKKDLARNKKKGAREVSEEEYIDYLKSPYLKKCGFYSDQVKNWKESLKEGHLLIGHYEDLSARPKEFVKDVFSFLEVDVNEKYISPTVGEVVNPAGKGKIPSRVHDFLVGMYREELKWLKENFNLDYTSEFAY